MLRILIPALAACGLALAALAVDPVPYAWGNMRIGGGGYVVGIVFHPGNPDVKYIRTDVGGAYRYDMALTRMVPITDWIRPEDENLYGCFGLDVDPTDDQVVYIALGKYPDRTSGVYKSTDQGRTWTSLDVPKGTRFGGNRGHNRYGKPLVVNPLDPRYLWVGTMGDGVLVYDGREKTWTRIAGVPAGESVRNICFDRADARHVYVAVRGEGVFRSTDGGKTFTGIGGLKDITDMTLTPDGSTLYVSSNSGLQRLSDAARGTTWKDITPPTLKGSNLRTIGMDPTNPKRLITISGTYASLRRLVTSEDGGDTWVQRTSKVQPQIPTISAIRAGSAIASFAFDPRDPKQVWFSDWYSVYRTEDITADPIVWKNDVGHGHEEVCTLALASPPTNSNGYVLFSGHADVAGFCHTADPDVLPRNADEGVAEVVGVDFCEADPEFVLMAGTRDWGKGSVTLFASHDGGKTWGTIGSPKVSGTSRVAVSALNKDVFVMMNKDALYATADGGKTFSKAAGLPGKLLNSTDVWGSKMHPLAADRVNGHFYLYQKSGAFYRSEDGGKTWTTVVTNLPTPKDWGKWMLVAVPGKAGHLVLAMESRPLHVTTDGGATWTACEGMPSAMLAAVGKELPGTEYPAIYVLGTAQGDTGLWYYRSPDRGKTWQRINDEAHRLGCEPNVLCADRQIAGRVYLGSSGRGVFYGQPAVPVAE